MISTHPKPQLRLALFSTLGAIALSVLFFAPRLMLMRGYSPETFQWYRAHTFLLQCEDPFRRDIEPAMLWRLLPPIVCHFFGLRGWAALMIPWLGVVASTFYVAQLHAQRLLNARFVFGGTLLFATTSAVLAPIGWLGLNDGWIWLGLLTLSFGKSRWAVLAACLFCPWVDERFIIGLPLALAVRQINAPFPFDWQSITPVLGIFPYIAARIILFTDVAVAEPTRLFLHESLRNSVLMIPWAQIAWWMGLRVAWVSVAYAIWFKRSWGLATGALLTLLVCMLLAADMSRSAAILCPLILMGSFGFALEHPAFAPRVILILGITNLFIPAAHVTFTKFELINNLATELFRLWRAS